jgi:hypothetical protein
MVPLVCFINNEQFNILRNIIQMIHMTVTFDRFYIIYTLQEDTPLMFRYQLYYVTKI